MSKQRQRIGVKIWPVVLPGVFSLVIVVSARIPHPADAHTALVIPNPIPQSNAWFGYWVTTGDLNNDGFSDLAVGAYYADVDGQRDAGRVDIFLGGPGFDNTVDMMLQSPTPQEDEEFGVGLAIGDINGDGFADLIVGAEGAHIGNLEAGRVYVYFGGPSLLDPNPDLILQSPQPQHEAGFGRRITTGDIDGDGALDILVSAYLMDVDGQRDAGEVYVYRGGRQFDTVADARLQAATPQAEAWFGFSITSGDINADRYDDIIVGALFADVGNLRDAGRAEIFFGQVPLPERSAHTLGSPRPEADARFGFPVDVGDVNNDGLIDLLVGSYFSDVGNQRDAGDAYIYLGGPSFSSIPTSRLISPTPRRNARFGYSFAVGNVVGDERPDLVVGADQASLGLFLGSAGEAFIFDGGIPSEGGSTLPLPAPNPEPRGYYGFRLTVADLDGDGSLDLIVTAIGSTVNGRRGAGSVYVYLSE